tara:strand:+ start:569 stop:1387 length:819 start_codon:yes stop_codon:yes gene_type:complete
MSAKNLKLIQQGLNDEHASLALQHTDSLPNFIIIGAAKSATTTLTTILPKHPDIFISKPKEPKFFGRYYSKGWDWYANRFSDGQGLALRGEGSTMYTSQMKAFKDTPELMHRHLPKLKLIYIVRHPLDRIVSQWRHYRGRHPECPDFSDFMDNKKLRRLIVGCSMYYQQLSRFRQFYPDEQIHCMTFEDLLSNPKKSLRNTLRFLGVKPKIKKLLDSNGCLPRVNEAGDKGRTFVEKPSWDPILKWRVSRIVRHDSEQMLNYLGKPKTYWNF